MDPSLKKAYLQMHISIFLWGFTGILGRLIELREGMLVFYRLILTSSILFLILVFSGKLQRIPLKAFLRIGGVGILVTLHWLFFYGAIKFSNVSVTLSCLASTALFTSIFQPLIGQKGRKRFSLNYTELIFAGAAFSGIYLIFSNQNSFGLGIVLALIASALGALFTVFNKLLVGTHNPETVTLIELASGAIFLGASMPLYLYLFPTEKLIPEPMDWLYLFLLSFFCTIIPFVLSLHALQRVTAFTINLALNLEPVYGILLAFLVFHENRGLGTPFYAGTLLILLSVAAHSIYIFKSKKELKTNDAS